MTKAKVDNEIYKGLQKSWNSTKTDVNTLNKLGIRSVKIYPSKTQQTAVRIGTLTIYPLGFIIIIAVLALIIMLKQGRVKTHKLLTQPKEKILFLTGIATFLELLYPPRTWIFHGKHFLGFHPIWETDVGRCQYVPVDCSLLIIEVIVTIFIGLSIYLLVKSQEEKTQ